jgi:hypothetical protein
VTFGGVAASSLAVVNANTITCVTPAGVAGLSTVTVHVTGGATGSANVYTYIAPPVVSACSPNFGLTLGGQSVTITGANFANVTSVTFGGVAATSVAVVNSTTITCAPPAHAPGVVDIVVTVAGNITGTGPGLYTYKLPSTGFNMPMMGI